jgi:DNA-binding SARP family transcriptional activator/class 3 adenylate cyclase
MGSQLPDGPVTILFSDVEGSTDLRTERGDLVAHRILRAHEEFVRGCVAAHAGREVKALGDGFMIVFASVRKALTCAVAIQVGLAERNAAAPDDEVRVRIGVNTGEVVAEGDDLYGQAVNAAARIAGRADSGEVLVSEIVRQLAGSGPEFTFVDRGRHRLKGFPDRWQLYGLTYDTAAPNTSGVDMARMSELEFRMLGPLEVRRGGDVLPLPPGRPRALLALLLLRANTVVAADQLIDELWRGDPPRTAGHALQVHVANLRKLLDEPGRDRGGAPVLATRRPGYVLEVAPEQCDARRFEQLTASGGRALDEGRPDEAAALFADALALWRGPVLADLADEPFITADATRLAELRLVTTERRVEAELALGHHAEVTGELEALVQQHPLRERLWAHLMVALYRSGRQADALAAYQRVRTVLAEELGLEPTPELRRLETAVLRQDPDLLRDGGRTGADPRIAASDTTAPLPPRLGFLPAVGFFGRDAELQRLADRYAAAADGGGGVVVVAGDPGMGKTRLIEEAAGQAARHGARVLWGQCYEGDWTPPYAAFVEALGSNLGDPDQLRADLGGGGPALAQLVPELRRIVPDLPEAVPLSPDEERFRLIDAAGQYLVASSRRTPIVICLDDLQWADHATLGLLRSVARLAARNRLLILGTYRDVEVDADHPLAATLQALSRETTFDRIRLGGLDPVGTTALLSALGEHDVDERIGAAWVEETEGNPFFIAELARHLIEEGHLYRDSGGRWTTDRPLRDLDVPETVRDVISRRLSRLSEDARQVLRVACIFEGPFRFDVIASVARLDADAALDAVDDAIAAQLILPAGDDTYRFHHALIRHTLYRQLGSSRRLRLHRQVAEALEAAAAGSPTPVQAGEIAAEYHRSAALPGAAQGVDATLTAADHAQASGGHDEALRFLRMALDLLPDQDPRRPRLAGRLGIVLAWALRYDEAVAVAIDAGTAIAETEGNAAAADYLADAMYACAMAGGSVPAWELAGRGLLYTEKHDLTWARLASFEDERRAAMNPDHPGIPVDSAERRESAAIIRQAPRDPMGPAPMEAVYDTRDEALQSPNLTVLTYWAGDYRRALSGYETETAQAERDGRWARAARGWSYITALRATLGDIAGALASVKQAEALAARLGRPLPQLFGAKDALTHALDTGWEDLATAFEAVIASSDPGLAWTLGGAHAVAARARARIGRTDEALAHLVELRPWLERAPAWTNMFTAIPCHAAETLWHLQRTDEADVIERILNDKVIGPDFRIPGVDGRLSLARLCVLTGRDDEAASWFTEARRVLTEQGALPLLAVCDHDEALMHLRRGKPTQATPLLDAAHRQFAALGMTAWSRRTEDLAKHG